MSEGQAVRNLKRMSLALFAFDCALSGAIIFLRWPRRLNKSQWQLSSRRVSQLTQCDPDSGLEAKFQKPKPTSMAESLSQRCRKNQAKLL